MSHDYVRDTPLMTRPYCPSCESEVEHQPTELLEVRWCHLHTPATRGTDDGAVDMESYPAGSSEAGGWENRALCELLHRRKLLTGRGTNG